MNRVIASVGRSLRRPREIRARLSQDLVRLRQFANFTLEFLHPGSLVGGQPFAFA
jgi:hypothetical protein